MADRTVGLSRRHQARIPSEPGTHGVRAPEPRPRASGAARRSVGRGGGGARGGARGLPGPGGGDFPGGAGRRPARSIKGWVRRAAAGGLHLGRQRPRAAPWAPGDGTAELEAWVIKSKIRLPRSELGTRRLVSRSFALEVCAHILGRSDRCGICFRTLERQTRQDWPRVVAVEDALVLVTLLGTFVHVRSCP